MKKVFPIFLFLSLLFTAFAQREDYKTSVDTLLTRGEHDVGWIHAHLLDNWYFDFQGGAMIYRGYQDNLAKLKDRMGLHVEAHLGRWMFPMVGYRFDMGIGSARGYISKDTYLQDEGGWLSGCSYGSCEGTSTTPVDLGDTVLVRALGGYYWTTDDYDDLLLQKWNYFHIGGDLMVNLSNFKAYQKVNFERKFQQSIYAGFALYVGISEHHPEISYNNTNFAASGHIGYMPRYFLTKNLNIYADLRLSIVEGLFDRELVSGIEGMAPDLFYNAQIGFGYDFNMRSNKKRLQYYIENGILPYNATTVPKNVAYVQVEDVEEIRIIDTLMVYHVDTIDDLVIINRVDSLQTALDSIIHRQVATPVDTPLDSIFLKRLLPYEMVFFDLDKWDFRPAEEMKVAKMARIMKAYPNEKFLLIGSADSRTGTVKRNNFLSHQRADVVYDKLIIQYGINPDQLKREYLGGIDSYDPFILNRTTVIIMDHPAVRKGFEEMKQQRKAGGNVVDF